MEYKMKIIILSKLQQIRKLNKVNLIKKWKITIQKIIEHVFNKKDYRKRYRKMNKIIPNLIKLIISLLIRRKLSNFFLMIQKLILRISRKQMSIT